MKRILERADVGAVASGTARAEEWTCIVPMAGRGTRFGYERPKALFPILGRPMLAWLIELFGPRCARFVLIASPEGEAAIRKAAEEILSPDRLRVAVQERPRGMADAIRVAEPHVSTPSCVVVWGDQIGLRASTVDLCMKAHHREGAGLTLPTVVKSEPYIHFERDDRGRIRRVLEARERPIELRIGENDCGVFFFDSRRLFNVLAEDDPGAIGLKTRELNLLPLVPKFEDGPSAVVTLRIASEEETYGINTREEAERMAAVLAARREGEA